MWCLIAFAADSRGPQEGLTASKRVKKQAGLRSLPVYFFSQLSLFPLDNPSSLEGYVKQEDTKDDEYE